MSDQLIATHASATLANLKSGSLFSSPIQKGENVYETFRTLNKRFKKKGLRIIPLKITNKNVLVYLYRPEKLQEELNDKDIKKFLSNYGYNCNDEIKAVSHLATRVKNNLEFPHEIGLFLGYPLEDVNGFIQNKQESKMIGYWRVYGDVEKAKQRFDMYKKCTDIFTTNLKRNITLEEMTIETGGSL